MVRYTWGVDGQDRAHICIDGEWEVIFSMISDHGQIGVWILEEQDRKELRKQLIAQHEEYLFNKLKST